MAGLIGDVNVPGRIYRYARRIVQFGRQSSTLTVVSGRTCTSDRGYRAVSRKLSNTVTERVGNIEVTRCIHSHIFRMIHTAHDGRYDARTRVHLSNSIVVPL